MRLYEEEKQQQVEAVNKIAAVHRGRLTRRMVLEKKKQDAAAHQVAAVKRGRISKTDDTGKQDDIKDGHEKIDDGESTVDSVGAKIQLLKDDSGPKDQYQAPMKIQAAHIGKQISAEQSKANAVNKIAAIQRGRKVRKQVQEKKDHTAAVTKIASVYRGRQVRKDMRQRKEQTAAVTKIAALRRGRKVRIDIEEKKARIAAVNKIAAVQRGRVVRKAMHKCAQEDSAAKLQTHDSKTWSAESNKNLQKDVNEVLRHFGDEDFQHSNALSGIKTITDQEALKVKIADELAMTVQSECPLSEYDHINSLVTAMQGTASIGIEDKEQLKNQLNRELDSLVSDGGTDISSLSDSDGL